MKNLIIAAIALTFGGLTNVVSANTMDMHIVAEEDNRTPIKVEDLPEAIKKSLASIAFEGWTAVSAYQVEGVAGSYYEVTLTKEAEKKTVNLDKDGNTVK